MTRLTSGQFFRSLSRFVREFLERQRRASNRREGSFKTERVEILDTKILREDNDDPIVDDVLRTVSIYKSRTKLLCSICGIKYIPGKTRKYLGVKRRASLHNFSKNNTRKRVFAGEDRSSVQNIRVATTEPDGDDPHNREWCSGAFNNFTTIRLC